MWRRHALTAAACRAGVKALGAQLWPARESIAAPTATAVRVPDGLSDTAIVETARNAYGVAFSLGRGATLGKLLRIGHMGPTAEPVYAPIAVMVLGGALRKLGFAADVAAGVDAAMAAIEGPARRDPARQA